MKTPLILSITGLPSSGKGIFSEIAEEFGYRKFVMGDVIREECKSRGLEVNRENSDYIMIKLRQERGKDAIAVITMEWIKKAIAEGEQQILIDGVRSRSEIDLFNKHLDDLILVGIHASQQTRLTRALNRGREDDAFNPQAFYERDEIELNLGVGDVIATCDILIVSESTLEDTMKQYREVLTEIAKMTEERIVARD